MFTYNIKQLPFVSMMGRAQEKVGWSHSGRCMPINLIAVMRAGECIFKINETDYHLKAGDVVLVPKNTYYKPHTDSRCEYTFFHFDGDLCEIDQMDAAPLYGGQNLAGENLYGYFEERPVSLLLDYILAFTVIGLAGILRRYGFVGMLAGVAIVSTLRFLSHFLAGVILWANLEQFVAFGQEWTNRPVLYSIVYNGSYMLPELILTIVGAAVLLKIPQINRLITNNGEA